MLKRAVLSCAVIAIVVAVSASKAHANFMVFGEEPSAGNYSFTLVGMPGDPVQDRRLAVPTVLEFAIDLPGLVIITPAGNISDGVNSLTPTLFGWTAVGFDSFAPAGVNSVVITASGDAGTDLTTVVWRFHSEQTPNPPTTGLFGFVKTGDPVVPEPSSIALLGMGGLALFGYGWRRKRKTELSA
jgi:hypothetical protein